MDADAFEGDSRSDFDLETVRQFEFEVPWPPKHVAAYLIRSESDDGETVLIDAGPPGERASETLRDGLAALGREPSDVDHVLLTHPHTDHTGQVPTLREAGATIHAPRTMLDQLDRDEAALVESARSTARAAGYEGDELETAVERATDSLRRNRRLVTPSKCHPVDREDPFTIGGRTMIPVHTPGHQIHHTCYETAIEGDPVLFSGDALIEPFRPGILHVGLDHGAYDGVDAFRTAMDRLDGVDAPVALPGHGPPIADVDAVVRSTREALSALVAETASAVEAAGPATPLAVAAARTGEVRYPVQVLDTMAALGTLEREGDVTHDREDGVRYYRAR